MSEKNSQTWLQLVDDALLAHERGDMDEFCDIMERLRMSLEWDTLTETMSPIVVGNSNIDNINNEGIEDGYYSITTPLYQMAWDEYMGGNYQSAINHLIDIMDILDSDSENFQWDFAYANFILGSLYYWKSENPPLTVEKELTLRKNAEECLTKAYEFIDMSPSDDDKIQCRLRLGIIRGFLGNLTEKEKLFTEALNIVKNKTIPNHAQVEMAIVTDLTWLVSQRENNKGSEEVYAEAAQVMMEISNARDEVPDLDIDGVISPVQQILPSYFTGEVGNLSTRGILKQYFTTSSIASPESSTPKLPLYMHPIPPKKLRNALKACRLKSDEKVIALFDTTVFGSAKKCILFTDDGLYYRNDWTTQSPKGKGPHFKPYSEMIVSDWEREMAVGLGGGDEITVHGAGTMARRFVTELLQSICSK